MSDQLGKYYVKRQVFEHLNPIKTEKIFKQFERVTLDDKNTPTKLVELEIKITSHRLIIDVPQNKEIMFLINYSNIKNYEKKNQQGMFCCGSNQIKEILLHMSNNNGQPVSLQAHSSILQQIFNYIQMAVNEYNRSIRNSKNDIQHDTIDKQSNMYKGGQQIKQQKEKELLEKENQFDIAFKEQSIEALTMHVKELKNIINYIQDNVQEYQQNSETDKLLKEIGNIDIISRDEAGDQYEKQIADQIYQDIFLQLIDSYGGMIPLLDIHFLLNKKRGSLNPISPKETLRICEDMPNIYKFPVKISIYNNLKVIEKSDYSYEKNFDIEIGQYIEKTGTTPQQLVKKLNERLRNQKKPGEISIFVATIKLQQALKIGKLVLDDRVEGVRYFHNCILFGFN